jgi:hypothetical protein
MSTYEIIRLKVPLESAVAENDCQRDVAQQREDGSPKDKLRATEVRSGEHF